MNEVLGPALATKAVHTRAVLRLAILIAPLATLCVSFVCDVYVFDGRCCPSS